THTFTITDDDDPPTIGFSATIATVTEANTATLTVDLSAASGKNITVNYAVQASSTATGSGTDYTLADGTATISAGSTSTTILIPTVSDALDEDNETIVVLLSSPSNATLEDLNKQNTITITDDDPTPTVQFNITSASYAEGTASHNIQVDLSAVSGRDVSVAYSVAAGSPAATGSATDYTLADGTLTISAGSPSANITFTMINDSMDEWAEKFVITLSSSPTNATIGTNTTHTATITDDDAVSTIDFASATSSVNENVSPATITANLSAASGKDIAVFYIVTAGSPAATGSGTDYTLANDSLKISAGSTSGTISAVIVEDALDENDEKLVATLSGVGDNVTIGITITAHTLTITDNDDAPTIAFTALNNSGNEAVTPATVTAQISAVSGLDVTADYAITGTATGGNTDYSLANGTVSITAGGSSASLSATITEDKVVETDETIIVTLSNPTNATLGTITAHTYTILNDDSPPADFTVDTVIATGGTVSFRYWNSTNTGLRVDVPVANSDDLVGGTIQLRAKKGVLSYEDLSSAYTIVSLDKATTKQMTATAAEFEAITGFAEDSVITITAIITDKYGNSTTGTASVYTTTIDQTAPAGFTLGTVTVTGGTVVSDYWNSTNTGVSADVPILATDATLTDGSVRLQARSGSAGTWTSVGQSFSVSAAEVTAGTKTITASASGTGSTDIEEVSDGSGSEVGDGKEFFFRAVLTDVAGNSTTSTESTSSPLQDQTAPTFTNISSSNADKAYKAGDIISISITVSTIVNVTQIPKLNLETGSTDGQASYTSGTGSTDLVFTYVVASGHTSSDLGYTTTSAFTLDGGTIRDVAGNDLDITSLPTAGASKSLKANKAIVIDTQLPSVTLTFDDPDTLVRFEDGTLNITATFSDSVQIDSIPKITIDFPGVTSGDVAAASMIRTSGTVYTYSLSLIDGSTGTITITLSAYDNALNALPADSVFRGQAVTIDNTDPAAFTTGTVTAIGDTVVVGWFNDETDSLKIVIPISSTDESLLDGGDLNVQMRVPGKMTISSWATIITSDASSPSAPADSIKQLGGNQVFFRTKQDILSTLTPLGLAQGDTILIRGVINDKVGNITNGTQSTDFFVLDTLPPTIGTFITDTFFTAGGTKYSLKVNLDTTLTNDTISFAIKDWVDPSQTNEKSSGIERFEYAVHQSQADAKNGLYDLFRNFKKQSNQLDTVIIDTFALTHKRFYFARVRAVDVAGNTSVINTDASKSSIVYRLNVRPVVDSIPDTTANEDVLWEQLLTVNDKDLLTLRSDVFSYALTTMKIDTTKSPIDSTVVTNLKAAVTQDGKVTFTPTKLDTASYVFRVIVTDAWILKDTVDIDLTVLPVNDPPVIDLSSIAKLVFLEGTNSDSINLTRYSYDEDNDTTDLKYSFRIASTLPEKGGYPTAKVGFLSDFDDGFKKSFITKLVNEFPSSTIIQKNNTFLVYAANMDQFKDPIKVDSLVQGDSVFTWIMPTDTASRDTNYYTSSDMLVEFTVIDPDGLEGKDTVTFFINPINDLPVWANLRDTTIKENDSLYLDFANYLTDVDDSTLTITILPLTFGDNVTIEPSKAYETKASGIEYSTSTKNDTVKFKPDTLWFGPNGPWVKNNSDSTLIQVTAADGDTSAIDTFIVRVQRVPRPEIRMYVVQNNAFTNYYEIFLVDSVGKTQDLTLKIQSKVVTLDTAAAFTYVGHYDFKTKGNYVFEVAARGVVGDTSVSETVGLTLAKMFGTWSGRSADGQFQIIGKKGAVDFDQSIMILDSTLFGPYFNDRASYLLGNEAFYFKKSVEISMPGKEKELALYQRSTGSGWVELPSITQGSRVMAYTEKMGYFRMGPKTLIVPGQTALQQNYPNPFNPVTTIQYDLGFVDGPFQKVNLTVYDLLGRNVKTLVNEQQGIGRYRLKWNGRDQKGVPVASGIYFIHLLTDMGRSQTKKIMLMR
ncbi:T9SS type A sorting domain-containing protein, partial [Caldithrix abyssi]|nr:T9SS type A sorting domain-containing protein [Caldithrix abyssi]